MKLVSGIVDSGFFAQSALSAEVATKDSLGRDISETYLTGDLSNYATKDFVNDSIDSATSGLLPTSSFSSVSGSFLTAVPSDLISSQSGTIFVNGYEIEGTNSAITTANVEGFVTSLGNENIGPIVTATFSWYKSLPNTVFTFNASWPNRDTTVTYSADTNLTGEIIAPGNTATKLDVSVPNATTLNVWADDWIMIADCSASAADSIGMTVGELAWASALPTYQYDSSNKISAINGSALANYELPQSASEAIGTVTANSATWNSVTNKLDTTAFSDVSGTFLTAHQDLSNYQTTAGMTAYQPAGDYLTTADSAEFYTTANESGFITGVDLTPYQLTAEMTAYQPAGDYLTTGDSANFYTTANESGFITGIPNTYLQNTDLTIADNKVTEISGIPLAGGGEVPEGVMVESGLEYNSQSEVTGYSGSAFATVDSEKQMFVHDDTLVHLSNSAQYALGVNVPEVVSASQQIIGPMLNTETFAGYWNGYPEYQQIQELVFTSNTGSNSSLPVEVQRASAVESARRIDVSNSFILYGNSWITLPIQWYLASNRCGGFMIYDDGIYYRGVDSSPSQCTAYICYRYRKN